MVRARIRSQLVLPTFCSCLASCSAATAPVTTQVLQRRTPHNSRLTAPSAVQALLASATLQPNNVQAHLLLSRIFRGQRKFDCALHHVLETLSIQGDSVETLAALVFLLQHNAERAAPAGSHLQHMSNISISDAQHRLCRALHAAAASLDVTLPASICFPAPPALLMQHASYSAQWAAFFRAHMPSHMLSNSFVPGQYPCFMFQPSSRRALCFAASPNVHCMRPPSQTPFPTFLRAEACC